MHFICILDRTFVLLYSHTPERYTQNVSNELGTLLHYHRNRLQLSQGEAADRVGATQQSWSRWEAGLILPPLHRIVRISKGLGIDIGDLRAASERDDESRHEHGERPVTRVQQLEQRQAELEAELIEMRELVQRMNGATPLAPKAASKAAAKAQSRPRQPQRRRGNQ